MCGEWEGVRRAPDKVLVAEGDWVHRLVPECVPRWFAEPTPELTARVARGLRGLSDDGE